jgi:hypothetical protein
VGQDVFQVAVVCQADVASAQESAVGVGIVEVPLLLCVSGLSAEYLRYYFGKERICPLGFDESSLGVFLLQLSLFMHWKLNTPCHFFLDFSVTILGCIMGFIYSWHDVVILYS